MYVADTEAMFASEIRTINFVLITHNFTQLKRRHICLYVFESTDDSTGSAPVKTTKLRKKCAGRMAYFHEECGKRKRKYGRFNQRDEFAPSQ